MNALAIIACALLGLGIVLALVPITLRFCGRFCRQPEFHHSGQAPIPRLGGIALAGALIGLELFIELAFPGERLRIPCRSIVLWSTLAMFALGFWDDVQPLGAKKKLLVQILISSAVYCGGLGIETFKIPFSGEIVALGGWGWLATVFWLVGITNLINLIDGVDGLAGGISLMLMALLAYVGYHNNSFVLLTVGMTGALVGFLYFNFPPAKIYLGDGGAYLLGFLIGLFAIVGSDKGSVMAALIAPLFVLALPIVDTSLAILRRGLRGLPVFRPDRRHIHHHLLGMGMTRRQVVLSMYGVTLMFLGMGFAAFCSRGQLVPVLLGLAALLLLLCAGRLSFSREWFAVGRTLGNSLAMRRKIQYALSLTKWLELEGARCTCIEQLYQDLVFAARRLGFHSVKVTLADGCRCWSEPTEAPAFCHYRLQLHGGLCGTIELRGCRNPELGTAAAAVFERPNPAEFELLAEIVAEGWDRAASKSLAGRNPLRFGSKPATSRALQTSRGRAALMLGARLSSRSATK